MNQKGATKKKYPEEVKRELLRKAWPKVQAGHSVHTIAAWIMVPYGTLNQWINRLRKEGMESLIDHSPSSAISTEELNLILSFMESARMKPTPFNFKIACRRLKTSRKASTLYVYYRKQVTKN